MKSTLYIAALAAASVAAGGCTQKPHTIEVTNPLNFERLNEMVSLPADEVTEAMGNEFRILAPDSTEIVWQITYDGRLIFPASVGAGSTAVYTVVKGAPAGATAAPGAFVCDVEDVDAWEKDCAPYLLDRHGEPVSPGTRTACEMPDRGPLRVTVALAYGPYAVESDSVVTERRVVTFDRGALLNRTSVSYGSVSPGRNVAAAIAVREENANGYMLNHAAHYMAYSDRTGDTATVYSGVVAPINATLDFKPCGERHGDTVGYVLASLPYSPGHEMEYMWGTATQPDATAGSDAWTARIEQFVRCSKSPLKATFR